MSTIGGTLVDSETQEVLGYLAGSAEQVAANVSEGQEFVEGPYEPPETPPPDPPADFTWNKSTQRWQLTPEAEERRAHISSAEAQIAELNVATIEALRDLVLARDGGEAHRARLAEIDDRIRELRKSIKRA